MEDTNLFCIWTKATEYMPSLVDSLSRWNWLFFANTNFPLCQLPAEVAPKHRA